jgi:hypothetical protein
LYVNGTVEAKNGKIGEWRLSPRGDNEGTILVNDATKVNFTYGTGMAATSTADDPAFYAGFQP